VGAGAPVGARPLQDGDVAAPRRAYQGPVAPGTPLCPQPLQRGQVAAVGRHCATSGVPGTPVVAQPTEEVEVAVTQRYPADGGVPGPSVVSQPTEDVALVSGSGRIVPVADLAKRKLVVGADDGAQAVQVAPAGCAATGVPVVFV